MAAVATAAGIMAAGAGGRWWPDLGSRNPVDSGVVLDPDDRLVERCLQGDEAAWEDLVRTHTRRVYAICYRFTNNGAEAQDIAQDVFLRVFRTLKSYRSGEGTFVVWLAKLTRNLLIDHYRRGKMDRASESLDDRRGGPEAEFTAGSRTDALLAGREIEEILQAALQKLSPDLREAVILRDLEELEYKEMAAVLNVPEGTVKSRINRGRAELARVLRRQKVVV